MAKKVETVGIAQLCEFFGITRQTLHLWRQRGLPERSVSGRPAFVVAECIRWYAESEREKERDAADISKGALDKDEQMARKLSAEATLKELELAQKRRDLVSASDFYEQLHAVIGGFAAVAAGQLQRFERDMVDATTPALARRLSERIHVALMEGAQAFAEELDTNPDTEPPIPEDLAA